VKFTRGYFSCDKKATLAIQGATFCSRCISWSSKIIGVTAFSYLTICWSKAESKKYILTNRCFVLVFGHALLTNKHWWFFYGSNLAIYFLHTLHIKLIVWKWTAVRYQHFGILAILPWWIYDSFTASVEMIVFDFHLHRRKLRFIFLFIIGDIWFVEVAKKNKKSSESKFFRFLLQSLNRTIETFTSPDFMSLLRFHT